MLTVGVTGGIGSGKSLVCEIFRVLNIPVYSADAEARRIMKENPNIRNRLIEYFGKETYSGESLNRTFLSERIFENETDREFVNSIVHPAVHRDFIRWTAEQKDTPYVIEEAALIFESGIYRNLDVNLLVTAPPELRMDRIMKRDGLERSEVTARMSAQIKPEEAMKLADYVIVNDGKTLVLPQVLEIHQKIINRS